MNKKYWWRVALAVLLVGLLSFGTGLAAIPQDPPTKPADCPYNSLETGSALNKYTFGPGQEAYPALGASDILPDDKLVLLADCDEVGYLKVDYGDEYFVNGYYFAGKDDKVKGSSDGFWVYIWKNDDNTFTWKSNYPVYYVFAKGGPNKGNLYLYNNGSYCGTNLDQGHGTGWSHINFYYCVKEDDECQWIGETAWSAGSRYANRGNWATYTPYAAGSTVTLFAGRTMNAGTVHFSPAVDGKVTITITLNPGWRFEDVKENVKIQGYDAAPSGNPAPGRFPWKYDADENPFIIDVDAKAFYGIHVNVEWKYCE